MDCRDQLSLNYTNILIASISLMSMSWSAHAANGYFQLHNLMSAAQKPVPTNIVYNDHKLTLAYQEKTTGRVVNTQFANDGGMAGCGVTSDLVAYMYRNTGTVDLSKNYIALNVYSGVMGYDPKAPFWGNAEGALKGYLTQLGGVNNIAYPSIPYHRVIPSFYPAYLGLYNNGLNCGRWMEVNFDTQACLDRTTPSGISKFCPAVPTLTYTGQKMQGYVFDSCEDNNGWCRDDEAHIDVNGSAFTQPANYYLQWKFIKNPYYSDPKAPAALKDIWLAWFSNASKYWSYVAILNAENGIGRMAYNIGDATSPVWINSHVLGGDNNITWLSTSNNGQLWQIEPVNSLTDAAPPDNPRYQMRLFDVLGYPSNHGAIYQYNLLMSDGSLGQNVNGFYLFYKGGAALKPGKSLRNTTVLTAPIGSGTAIVTYNQLLPSNVSLNSAKTNYIRTVLINEDGYSYDPISCTANACTYTKLPTNATYHVFAHFIEDVSNDMTLRKVNDISVNSATFNFLNGSTSTNYAVTLNDMNMSTLYSTRVQIPLKFATTSLTPINANLQAVFVPDNTKNANYKITAQTQGCFLSNYVNTVSDPNKVIPDFNGNNSICTIYYTVNRQTGFAANAVPPRAFFTLMLPANVGIDTVNYHLSTSSTLPITVSGYNPAAGNPPPLTTVPVANYNIGTASTRSLYLMLDPESDNVCLKNLDPFKGVTTTVGSVITALTQPDRPIEIQLAQLTGSVSTQVNLLAGSNVNCVAQQAIIATPSSPLKPGLDVVEIIKLVASPQALPPKPTVQGIAAKASGDSACLGGNDTLSFIANGQVAASAPYQLSTTITNVGVNIAPGSYTITDQPFKVAGGTCQLATQPSVLIQSNVYTPTTLTYQFKATPSATCTATPQVIGSWLGGCSVQIGVQSTSTLNNVTLSWLKGPYDWTHATIWGGQGTLNIPADDNASVTWLLPTWVTGQGSSVGMNIMNDAPPEICAAMTNNALIITCRGISA